VEPREGVLFKNGKRTARGLEDSRIRLGRDGSRGWRQKNGSRPTKRTICSETEEGVKDIAKCEVAGRSEIDDVNSDGFCFLGEEEVRGHMQ
jgi:hypothetical protein